MSSDVPSSAITSTGPSTRKSIRPPRSRTGPIVAARARATSVPPRHQGDSRRPYRPVPSAQTFSSRTTSTIASAGYRGFAVIRTICARQQTASASVAPSRSETVVPVRHHSQARSPNGVAAVHRTCGTRPRRLTTSASTQPERIRCAVNTHRIRPHTPALTTGTAPTRRASSATARTTRYQPSVPVAQTTATGTHRVGPIS